ILLDSSGADTGDLAVIGGGQILLTGSRTIDTNQSAAAAGGSVSLGTSPVSATAVGFDLTIDTSATGAGPANGGNVSLAAFNNAAGAFVNDLSVTTTAAGAGTAGSLTLTGGILLDLSGVDSADVVVNGGG